MNRPSSTITAATLAGMGVALIWELWRPSLKCSFRRGWSRRLPSSRLRWSGTSRRKTSCRWGSDVIAWLKKQRWVVTLGMILSAVLLALAGAKSAKKRGRAEKQERLAEDLMQTGIDIDLTEAKRQTEKAEKNKQAAAKAKAKMEQRLEELGNANEDIDALADRFNSRRLRGS